jgi:hypothetical protein
MGDPRVDGWQQELWGRYGNLTEVWFDGGLAGMLDRARDLLQSLQPQVGSSAAGRANPRIATPFGEGPSFLS